MTATLLQQIKDANKSYLAGAPKALDAAGEPFVVVACIDPRLTGLLEPAMGLPRNRAIVVRTAGNRVSSDDRGAQRSVAAGLYLKHASEILIVGHTDCALSNFSAADVIERFRNAGVPRTAFGDEDLRSWFGAFSDIKANIAESIQYLRRSGLVPGGTKIHGLLLDTATSAVEVTWDGDVPHAEDITAKAAEPEPPKPQESVEATAHQKPVAAAKGPIVIGGERPSAQPMSLREVTAALKTLVARERGRPEFQRALVDLAAAVRERKPAHVLFVLDQMLQRYESQYPDLKPAFETLKSAIESKGQTGFNYIDFIRMAFE